MLTSFFRPKTVAVIGASPEEGKVGNTIMHNFLHPLFTGRVIPVNPKYETVMNKKCFKSVTDIKENIDLAVIAVPAAIAKQVVAECVKKKVKTAVMITSGFSEIGDRDSELEMRKMAQKSGMRIVGPNCLGIFDAHSGVDTLFLPEQKLGRPRKGSISFISQSGAVGSVILDWMSSRGYGLSKFVSYGNAMDVSESDLLEYLADDASTKVICMYIEGVKDGAKFMRAAKKASAKKPVIVLKGGKTEAGAHAASSHTGSLAGADAVYDAAFKQSGVIRAKTLSEMFNFARVLSEQPLPRGGRIGIVTNGGGFGVLAADEVVMKKLELANFSEKTRKELEKAMPSYGRVNNPLDLVGDADDVRYQKALSALAADPNTDAILCILLFQTVTMNEKVIPLVIEAARSKKKPIVVCSAGGEYVQKLLKKLEEKDVPVFDTPSSAVDALDALVDYANIKKGNKWSYE